MRVTLTDIARRASVSVSTVSRVLNNQDNVSREARASVMQAVEALGYDRHAHRKTDRTGQVLLLIREDASETNPDGSLAIEMERLLLAGAQSMLKEHGIATKIVQTHMRPDEAVGLVDDPDNVGVVVLGGVLNRGFLSVLLESNIHVVVAGAHVRPLAVDCVMPDFHQGMMLAVEHLVERGRRCIGLVNGPPTTSTSEEKYLGLRLALALHDLPYCPEQVISGSFTFDSGDAVTRRLLKQCPEVDAIIYGDDNMAVGGLRALREMGIQVPRNISIVGHYDYEIARFTDPPLTSVRFDKFGLGAKAALRMCMLLDQVDDHDCYMLMNTTLEVRASS